MRGAPDSGRTRVQEKWGGETALAAAAGARSLRGTAEAIYGSASSAQQSKEHQKTWDDIRDWEDKVGMMSSSESGSDTSDGSESSEGTDDNVSAAGSGAGRPITRRATARDDEVYGAFFADVGGGAIWEKLYKTLEISLATTGAANEARS